MPNSNRGCVLRSTILFPIILIATLGLPSLASGAAYTPEVRNACRVDYKKFAASMRLKIRATMHGQRRAQVIQSNVCVDALIRAVK
jgi:hypothetical protein